MYIIITYIKLIVMTPWWLIFTTKIDVNTYKHNMLIYRLYMLSTVLLSYQILEIMQYFWFSYHPYARLRSTSGLKSASTPHIGIHWRHYLKSWPDLKIFLNLRPFQILGSKADLLVRVRAYVSDVIERWFEKVRNDHRFENWMPI